MHQLHLIYSIHLEHQLYLIHSVHLDHQLHLIHSTYLEHQLHLIHSIYLEHQLHLIDSIYLEHQLRCIYIEHFIYLQCTTVHQLLTASWPHTTVYITRTHVLQSTCGVLLQQRCCPLCVHVHVVSVLLSLFFFLSFFLSLSLSLSLWRGWQLTHPHNVFPSTGA